MSPKKIAAEARAATIRACDAVPIERAPCCALHAARPGDTRPCRPLCSGDLDEAVSVAHDVMSVAPTGPFAVLARAFLALAEDVPE